MSPWLVPPWLPFPAPTPIGGRAGLSMPVNPPLAGSTHDLPPPHQSGWGWPAHLSWSLFWLVTPNWSPNPIRGGSAGKSPLAPPRSQLGPDRPDGGWGQQPSPAISFYWQVHPDSPQLKLGCLDPIHTWIRALGLSFYYKMSKKKKEKNTGKRWW